MRSRSMVDTSWSTIKCGPEGNLVAKAAPARRKIGLAEGGDGRRTTRGRKLGRIREASAAITRSTSAPSTNAASDADPGRAFAEIGGETVPQRRAGRWLLNRSRPRARRGRKRARTSERAWDMKASREGGARRRELHDGMVRARQAVIKSRTGPLPEATSAPVPVYRDPHFKAKFTPYPIWIPSIAMPTGALVLTRAVLVSPSLCRPDGSCGLALVGATLIEKRWSTGANAGRAASKAT